MRISVEKAAGRLNDLIEIAKNGEGVVITRNDQPAAILKQLPSKGAQQARPATKEEKRLIIQEIRANAAGFNDDGVSAARSQDFLYDENGLPG